ncbi:MAG: hypothetical protein MRY49_02495 [Candidatus Pacebacteria bacterium]|nr:hypothetical protein [Candidatus Paceibacterota bacterium]
MTIRACLGIVLWHILASCIVTTVICIPMLFLSVIISIPLDLIFGETATSMLRSFCGDTLPEIVFWIALTIIVLDSLGCLRKKKLLRKLRII